ncbi:unnamed protein product [Eruca vesicaria subsp. sativa]|uniref:PARP-type domain-containing protein n=1 Tax=Eruca vesicaria subsp. sativa TaxID=29727 RepID=A0ABC8KRI0_ERUVS|nr:unnamed protein product [Eruca vesicaria subsp. sativa]
MTNKILPEKMPIVAEYANSNRSSCKSCSNSIASKNLRVCLISKGPGGFDMTSWHHFDCFPTDSESIASVDDIKCLSALESGDQDALKELVLRFENKLTEETNKRKHSQVVGEMVEEDELQTNTSQPTTRKPKLQSTSLVVAEAEISLSASDVKDKYRDASLLPKWKVFETVIFLERFFNVTDYVFPERAITQCFCSSHSAFNVGADAWSLMYPSIPEKLQSLHSQGYKLAIFTNESKIGGRIKDKLLLTRKLDVSTVLSSAWRSPFR